MKLKALIIESTGYYQSVLGKILSDMGVECDIFTSGKDLFESGQNKEYAFIIVSRYLDDMSGELFMYHYRKQFTLGDALTIMITADEVSEVKLDATKAGFQQVFNKKEIDLIQSYLTDALNKHALDLNGHILLVEDQKSVAAATVALLEQYHANVDHVTNLAEAKEKFSISDYDLVITDYYLKNKETGDDIIAFVRGFDDIDKARVPILVLSGETDQTKRTSLLRQGANDFIIKPYDNDELIVRSSNLIENKKILQQTKKQQEELTKLAMTDQLTGLYNRHSLTDIGPKYLSDAKRHKFPVSLLVFDLDHFKNVNDTHGHAVGDIVLKIVGKVLNDNCRSEDFVARFGGEEFVMLLSHCDIDNTATIAEKLRKQIEISQPNGLTITASIGAAGFSEGDDFDSLFVKADKAVYEAKDTGRNKVSIYK